MRIYIDTSVINGLYAQDAEIKRDTAQFFKNVHMLGYTLYASEATIEEIDKTPQGDRKNLLKNVIDEAVIKINRQQGYPIIEISSPKEV